MVINGGEMEHTWVDHKVEQCCHCRNKVVQVSQLDQGSHTSLEHLLSLPAISHNLLLKDTSPGEVRNREEIVTKDT